MKNVNRQKTTPVNWGTSKRNVPVPVITSVPPGVVAPLFAAGLYPMDGIVGAKGADGKYQSSRVRFGVEMAETKDRLINKVRARFRAVFVPSLAFERFGGSRDEWEKSFAGEQGAAGSVIPFIETEAWDEGNSAFYDVLGQHSVDGRLNSTAYVEAYNIDWNFRARNRSEKITPRARLDHSLAPAFWPSGRFEHLVSEYDEALHDGQVALDVINALLPVKGLYGKPYPGNAYDANVALFRDTEGNPPPSSGSTFGSASSTNDGDALIYAKKVGTNHPEIWAEFQNDGVFMSLANLEMAKKTQSLAKIRADFDGHTDDYIIDTFLMNGIRIPDQAMKQPIEIARTDAVFTMAERYSSTSGALDEKAVSGVAYGELSLRLPRVEVGGVILITVEILPDQLFERQPDPYLYMTSVDEWPKAMRDYADPYKVDVITNGMIDTSHSDPDGLFAHGPLNWWLNGGGVRIGGKYRKPAAGGGTNLLRNRFWAHEEVDPALSESFYLCQGLPTNIFLDEETDPFDVWADGNLVIHGNTQFGPALMEATDNYDKIMLQMDTSRPEAEA